MNAIKVKKILPDAFCVELPNSTYGIRTGEIPNELKYKVITTFYGFYAYGETRQEAWRNAYNKLT